MWKGRSINVRTYGKRSCVEIHKVGKGEDPRITYGGFLCYNLSTDFPSGILFGKRITLTRVQQRMHKMLFGICQSISPLALYRNPTGFKLANQYRGLRHRWTHSRITCVDNYVDNFICLYKRIFIIFVSYSLIKKQFLWTRFKSEKR